ncbi:MAG TPA: histone deacetylase family protein [Nocardioidaceae bacterium]|nr:histone deacetylase family protein [Nocardioidaceae bacterium]
MSPIPVVWSSRCREHIAAAEIWLGVRTPGTEVPERVDVVVDALTTAGHPFFDAIPHDDSHLAGVHHQELIDHLATVHANWARSGIGENVGQDRVVPYVFPTAAMLGDIPASPAAAVHGRAGAFCYDTMTLVGPGTWEAARSAVDCALTAVDLLDHTGSAYALCRPPGHHASPGAYGGSCYLNSAAVAAQALRRKGHGRVAVIDVDAHHGNGTSAIFYDRADVFYGSVHVDPGAGWFPHFVGHASERGHGFGLDANQNLPLAPGAGDAEFLEAVRTLAASGSTQGATAVVVSLGVDAAALDPESPLQVTDHGFRSAGDMLASLGLPTVIVQEGGYHLPSLGGSVLAFLSAYT